jgi:hypothetical protein
MLHNACERLLWRLVRLGLVLNREKALERVIERKCSIRQVARQDRDELIDREIEKWWEELERESIMKKWDSLANLVGFPESFNSPPKWHFDREMLKTFDDVRQNAVHFDGRDVAAFDIPTFADQLSRALMKWTVDISLRFGLKPRPEAFFGIETANKPTGSVALCE